MKCYGKIVIYSDAAMHSTGFYNRYCPKIVVEVLINEKREVCHYKSFKGSVGHKYLFNFSISK